MGITWGKDFTGEIHFMQRPSALKKSHCLNILSISNAFVYANI